MNNPYEQMRKMSVVDICKGLGTQTILFVGLGLGIWLLTNRELIQFVSIDMRQIGLGFALGFALIALAAAIFGFLPNLSERLTRLQAKNFAFLEKRLSMPVIIFMSICAGVGEEALFRGGLQTLLGDFMSIPLAIALSSLAFALIHFAKPLIAIIIFIIGATFGVFYVWTGSLLAVMIGHAIYDVYAFWFLQKEMHRLQLFEPREDSEVPEQQAAAS